MASVHAATADSETPKLDFHSTATLVTCDESPNHNKYTTVDLTRFKYNGRGLVTGHSSALHRDPPRKFHRRSRRKLVTMAASISLVILMLCTGVVVGTFYGIRTASVAGASSPAPEYPFPGALDVERPPSDSVLSTYVIQAVAADSAECSTMGNDILNKNGSAAEAAITVSLCTGLFHSHSSGIGGGFFMVAYNRKLRNATAVDAREVAPAAATELMFVENKEISSTKGWHAAGVPGEVAGYWKAFQLFGSGNLQWRELFEPVINAARNGFKVNKVLAKAIAGAAEDILTYDEALGDYFIKSRVNRTLYEEGDTIKMKKLADTMELIANDPEGVREFYHGKIAVNLAKDIEEGGGIMTLQDLNDYKPVVEDALHTRLRDNSSVFGVPPPAGSLVLQYIVKIMDGYDHGNVSWDHMTEDKKALFYQRFAEAMKFAYARRTEMGDEDFVPAVTEMKETLLSEWFAQLTRTQINEEQTSNDTRTYGVQVVPPIGRFGTAHFSIIDKSGNAVAMTSTINTHFGSRRVSKSTGIIMNNEMDDFTTNPRVANYYGLPPSRANRVHPGKRPQSSCSPVIVVDEHGDVRIVLGASGGSRIISGTANALLRVLYFGQNVKEAIDAPRLHHQLLPMKLEYERGFLKGQLQRLQEKGHDFKTDGDNAVVQGLVRSGNFTIDANCDYRKHGAPAGI